MKVFALVNTAAGSVGPDGKNRMLRMLSRSGISADVVVFDPESAASQVQNLLAKAPDLLVVWGGDGTHRTALSMAGAGRDNLVLLPGGTMNLLTKWIHGDKPWDIILQGIIARRARRTLGAGRVDDARHEAAVSDPGGRGAADGREGDGECHARHEADTGRCKLARLTGRIRIDPWKKHPRRLG